MKSNYNEQRCNILYVDSYYGILDGINSIIDNFCDTFHNIINLIDFFGIFVLH